MKQITHRDKTCPLYNTCSSLSFVSEFCSIKCFKETFNIEKKDKLLTLYQTFMYGNKDYETDTEILRQIKALEEELK